MLACDNANRQGKAMDQIFTAIGLMSGTYMTGSTSLCWKTTAVGIACTADIFRPYEAAFPRCLKQGLEDAKAIRNATNGRMP